MIFELKEVIEILADNLLEKVVRSDDAIYEFAVFDSREVTQNSIFIAIDGEKSAGVRYVEDAISRGAACVLVNLKYKEEITDTIIKFSSNCDFLFVEDSLIAFGLVGKLARNKFHGQVVGVIGSVGKTTTKNILREIGGGQAVAHASRGSYNNQTGVPLTLSEMPIDAKRAIIELGESHFGDLKYITEISRPTHLVLTNIASAHTAYLGDLTGVAKTMNETIEMMDSDSYIAVPNKTLHLDIALRNYKAEVVYVFEEDELSDFENSKLSSTNKALIYNVEQNDDLTHNFSLKFDSHDLKLRLPLVGRHFVIDAALAIVISLICGEDSTQISNRLLGVETQGHRMRVMETAKLTVIDDAYNANPSSMRACMDAVVAKGTSNSNRTVFFMGEMRELGDSSDESHIELAKYAQEIGIDVLVCVGPATKPAWSAKVHSNCTYFDEVKNAIESIGEIVNVGDLIGVKASRGPDPEMPFMVPIVNALVALS